MHTENQEFDDRGRPVFPEPTSAEIVRAILDEDRITAYELNLLCKFSHGYAYQILSGGPDGRPKELTRRTLLTVLRATGRNWGWIDQLTAVKFAKWRENQQANRRMEQRARGEDPDE